MSQLDNHFEAGAARHAAPGNKWMVFEQFDDYRPGAVMVFVERAARECFMDALAEARRLHAFSVGAGRLGVPRVPPQRNSESEFPQSSPTGRSR